MIPLTLATAVAGLALAAADGGDAVAAGAVAAASSRDRRPGRVAQFGVLGINAVSRQVVQNLDLKRYLDVTGQRVAVQWGPLAMFLAVFVSAWPPGVDDRAGREVQPRQADRKRTVALGAPGPSPPPRPSLSPLPLRAASLTFQTLLL